VEKEASQSSKLANDLIFSASSSEGWLVIVVAIVELLATSLFKDRL
jgi:hypothetical protein